MSILALLWWLYWQTRSIALPLQPEPVLQRLKPWAVVGLVLLGLQIALGGWTSTNYAAISCAGFPMCQLKPWHYDFFHAFNLLNPLGVDYQGGVLSDAARKTIQMTHRWGALMVCGYWLVLSGRSLFLTRWPRLQQVTVLILLLLTLQVALGISNVLLSRPFVIAILHNLTAACLLLAVVFFNICVFRTDDSARMST